MAIKTLRVFAEYTSTGFVPMPTAGGIDYGYTLASTFPSATPSSFQTDDPDIDVTVTAMTDFYVWIRINGTAWNPSYTRNVRVYPDSPDINSVVMNMIIATGPAGTSAYSQIVQTSNRLYFNGATTDSVYNSKFAGKTYINELNFGTAPGLATVATTGAYADLTGKPALSTVATSGSYADLSNKPSGTAPISYNSGTNSFQISVASASTNGYLTSTDWTTFNNKFSTPTGDTTQYVTGNGTLATFPVLASADKLVMVVRNTSGATITKGTVVYINGASGNKPTIGKALANADSTSAQTLGLVQSDIGNNSNGNVTIVGSITDIDTSAYTDGTQLYLSGTTAGTYTSTKTLAPTHLVYVGVVSRAHPTQGTIEVKVQNGYELDEIHDVQISSPANKDILYRDSASSLWKHASIATVLGYTPYNATNPNNYIALTALSASAPLSYNNTTGAFSITQANTTTNGFLSSTDWNTFNSKQSALTLGNVSEVSSNVLMFPDGGTGKTIGNLSIQVVQSSASTNGYLSSADWTTFNNKQATLAAASASVNGYLTSTDWSTFNSKQGAITLTTTGTSGAATFSANTLNIPQYQTALTNPVTGTGTTNYVTKWTSGSAVGSSLIFDNGTNVGIGTASPSSILHLSSASGNGTVVRFTSTSTNGKTYGIGSNFVSGAGEFAIYDYTAGAQRFFINTSGNIGIGTTTPSYNLHIKGADYGIMAIDTTGSYNSQLRFHINGSILSAITASSSDSSLQFYNNGSERMRITSAGVVNINRSLALSAGTYQSQKLVVTGGIGINSDSADGVARLSLLGDSSTGDGTIDWGGNGAFNLRFTNNGSERMRIASDGNVGIGTTSPNQKLHVAGNISIVGGTGSRIGFNTSDQFTANSTSYPHYGMGYGSGTQPVGLSGYYGVAFFTTGEERMRINNNYGNVSIGYAGDSGYKLYVVGTIYATSNITANSDLTLKKNLNLVDNPIDKLNQLNGYLYQWKENDEYQYGVIAQEVEKILPHAVTTGNNGIKGVAYNQLIPVMIEAIKEQNKKIIALEAKLG
jgi:hypothetical protein